MIETLKTAIANKQTIAFVYGPEERLRVVEVHAVGLSTKDGSLVMRGFQVAGESSRPLPIWALFTVSKMDALELSALPLSEAPRPGFSPGDKQMSEVLFEVPVREEVVAL